MINDYQGVPCGDTLLVSADQFDLKTSSVDSFIERTVGALVLVGAPAWKCGKDSSFGSVFHNWLPGVRFSSV